jgi:hypothetical protein
LRSEHAAAGLRKMHWLRPKQGGLLRLLLLRLHRLEHGRRRVFD